MRLVDVQVPYVCSDVLHSYWCLLLFIRSYQRIFRSAASLLVMIPLLIPSCTLLNNASICLKATCVSSLRHEQLPCDTSKEHDKGKKYQNFQIAFRQSHLEISYQTHIRYINWHWCFKNRSMAVKCTFVLMHRVLTTFASLLANTENGPFGYDILTSHPL